MKNLKSFCASLFKAEMILLWALFFVVLVPFILLVAYSHPNSDDWYMAALAREADFLSTNIGCYYALGGRYFSNALLSAHPILISAAATKVYCLVMVLSLLPAALWASHRWFPAADYVWKMAVGIMVVVVFFAGMPSPVQALYWLTGATCYFVPIIMFLVLAAIMGRECLGNDWRPARVGVAVCCLLAFFITGCSEIAMALLLLVLVVLNLVFFRANSRVCWPLFAMLVCVLAGIAIVLASPGNAGRNQWYSNDVQHVPVKAVVMALTLGTKQAFVWLTHGPLLLFAMVLIAGWPVENGLTRRGSWEMIAWSLVIMVGTVFGGFFLGTWSMGDYLPLRSVNQLYFFFVIGWLVFAGGVAALLRSYNVELPRLGPVLACCAFFIFVGDAMVGASRPIWGGGSNIKNAWRDLLSGSAAAFDKECYARYELIRSSPLDEVIVPRLKSRPPTLFYSDLSDDPANWRNCAIASFFRKRGISLEP